MHRTGWILVIFLVLLTAMPSCLKPGVKTGAAEQSPATAVPDDYDDDDPVVDSDADDSGVDDDDADDDNDIVVDTEAPLVTLVVVADGSTVDITYSEAMGDGVITAANYELSGSGQGSLAQNPESAVNTAGNTYRLTWNAGEMVDGGDITITVSGVSDVAGNGIGATNSATDAGAAIGVAPAIDSVAVSGALTVDVVFSESVSDGAMTAENYSISGTGTGSLATNPSTVASLGGNTYRLTWNAGEMVDGGDITITVVNAQDVAGNAVGSPNSRTHTGGGGTDPSISAITDQTSVENTATGAIAFTVLDAETATGSLSIEATSGNTTLVPDANILLGGADANRTITLTPAENETGTTTITIDVSDGTHSVSTDFDLTITPFCTGALLTNSPFAGGSGTPGDPYLICTATQLNQVGAGCAGAVTTYCAKSFEIKSDIDLSGVAWNRMGDYDNTSFSGTFDGNNYVVSNLTINSPGTSGLGFFGWVMNDDGDYPTIIENITLENVSVTGGAGQDVAGLIAYADACCDTGFEVIVRDVNVSGTVSGTGWDLGLVCGYCGFEVHLSAISSVGTVAGGVVAEGVGGLVGYLDGQWSQNHATIDKSWSTATVAGNSQVGGLVGTAFVSTISDSFATGDVTASVQYGGGVVGELLEGFVKKSYSTGDVSGDYSGGLVGYISGCTALQDQERVNYDNFSVGDVSCALGAHCSRLVSAVGCGDDNATVAGAWYNTESVCTNCGGGINSTDDGAYGAAFTSGWFYDKDNAPLSNWDFNTIWFENTGALPTLR